MRVTAETKETTRERLLRAAADEFGRAGLEAANVDAISLRAGYAKGTIYNYFPSKEDLFLAVVDRAASDAAASAPRESSGPGKDRVVAVLEGFCAWVREHEAFGRVLVRECLVATPSLYPRVVQAESPLVATLEWVLDSSHDVRDDVPPKLLALALAGMTDLALAQHWASDGTTPRLEEIPELVTTILLGPRPSGEVS